MQTFKHKPNELVHQHTHTHITHTCWRHAIVRTPTRPRNTTHIGAQTRSCPDALSALWTLVDTRTLLGAYRGCFPDEFVCGATLSYQFAGPASKPTRSGALARLRARVDGSVALYTSHLVGACRRNALQLKSARCTVNASMRSAIQMRCECECIDSLRKTWTWATLHVMRMAGTRPPLYE